ncbi:TPA: DUF99 family protein [archaeon]|uniref:UPF0215 protein H1016_00385 n=1 Tax=Candidatus Naiadarchaeum limnaeum TaxID=2756139 RepID=A0A832UUL3_9ARCH|nr:DUF99 family protein [Candidatus Naiadarchaeales archaeon SRR2090153.bin1042]HIJ99979.1 DUF99 family protein [Candidatus Naiadarchaeum limnaeum]
MKTTRFRAIKRELRILGIDDGPFKFKGKGNAILVGTVFRSGFWLDGLLTTKIKIDGFDATKKIIEMVNKSRHKDQLRVIMLDGLTFGGMNFVDIHKLNDKTGLPVIVVNRRRPRFEKIKNALKHFKDSAQRWKFIEKAGEIQQVNIGNHNLYIQTAGIMVEDAQKILKLSCTRAKIPEPLRVAHLIAAGIVKGESKGRA